MKVGGRVLQRGEHKEQGEQHMWGKKMIVGEVWFTERLREVGS